MVQTQKQRQRHWTPDKRGTSQWHLWIINSLNLWKSAMNGEHTDLAKRDSHWSCSYSIRNRRLLQKKGSQMQTQRAQRRTRSGDGGGSDSVGRGVPSTVITHVFRHGCRKCHQPYGLALNSSNDPNTKGSASRLWGCWKTVELWGFKSQTVMWHSGGKWGTMEMSLKEDRDPNPSCYPLSASWLTGGGWAASQEHHRLNAMEASKCCLKLLKLWLQLHFSVSPLPSSPSPPSSSSQLPPCDTTFLILIASLILNV